MHAPAARQQEEMLESALNKEIDDVVGEFQVKVKVRVRVAVKRQHSNNRR
jgi:hypothetical protein